MHAGRLTQGDSDRMNSRYRPDAVLVLANLMDRQGRLNPETQARVETAVSEMRRVCAPLLVTCGWAYRDDSDLCIADAMRRHAVALGVEPDAVIPERTPRDTVGDAVFTRRNLAIPRRWSGVLVVTSQYHAARTREIFSFVYGPDIQVDVTGAPSDDTAALEASEARSTTAFRSTFQGVNPGDDHAIFTRLREKHPFYNGDIFPLISDDR